MRRILPLLFVGIAGGALAATPLVRTNDLKPLPRAMDACGWPRNCLWPDSTPKALENVKTSIQGAPAAAPAHALCGQILAAQGNRSAALQAFAQALRLDPANQDALEGKRACEDRRGEGKEKHP